MYKIGIIGNGPERFNDQAKIKRSIDWALDLLSFQYNKDTTIYNIRGNIGVGMWTAESCKKYQQKYHLFLPFSPEITSEQWFDEQKEELLNHYRDANSITICNDLENINKCLIDASNFIVCFWVGNKCGGTYDAIHYAMKNNKILVDGLNDFRLITSKSL
jgi:uncharacterized phage-like protein YoqJ